jgi:hypothetical protein
MLEKTIFQLNRLLFLEHTLGIVSSRAMSAGTPAAIVREARISIFPILVIIYSLLIDRFLSAKCCPKGG